MIEDFRAGDLNMASFIEIEDEGHKLMVAVFLEEILKIRHEPNGQRHSKGDAAQKP
jgi:hypothetical protein